MNLLDEKDVLARVLKWAESNSSVRAAILTSSRVNPEPCVDQYSDYDIEVYVADLQQFWESDDWMTTAFGEILVRFPRNPRSFKEGWLTRLVVFKDGFRIDFQMTDRGLDASHYVDGYRVLVDKDGIADALVPPTYEGYLVKKPTIDEWEDFTNEFWWEAVYVAKALARDELFYAKYMFDAQVRFVYLKKLIEWSICVDRGWSTQPNKYGRFFKRLVDSQKWSKLESTFAAAGIDENWIALEKTLSVFRELSLQVARHFDYPYPELLDREVSEYIDSIRDNQIEKSQEVLE